MSLPVLGPAAVILQRLKASFPLFPLSSPKKRHFIYRNRRSDSKKEVFQPHLPVRLPCYDLAPVTGFALGRSFRSRTSGTPGSHGLTGGVYKARERIHRAMADARLLAHVCRPGRKGRADLTSSPPSSHLAVAVPPESPT